MKYLDNTESALQRAINQRFYMSAVWKKCRKIQLNNYPLCEGCLKEDLFTAGQEIHHIISISKDFGKRLDADNLMTLCKVCHSKITYSENKDSMKRPTIINYLDELLNKILNKK